MFMKNYKFVAPDVDTLINCFDRGFLNPSFPSEAICKAMDPLFETLKDLAPLQKNNEAKVIWITVPRGDIEDFGSYEEMLEWGEVKNREEYEQYWLDEYPEPVKWYKLILSEAFHEDGSRWFRAVHIGNRTIINAHFDFEDSDRNNMGYGREEAAIALCPLLNKAAKESMRKLKEGSYNDYIRSSLPYEFRTGVVPRNLLWQRIPKWKEEDLQGLSEETVCLFRELLNKGVNDEAEIGRLKTMTANDFFRACAIGYKACGYRGTDLPLVDQYFLHADGRDEGLSGRGHGLNEGPGIDFDDPDAWDEWYFHRTQKGGHPWEVCRGGNSTHVDLFVCHDQWHINYLFRLGKISESEYKRHSDAAGYYFEVAGIYRASEAVNFYTALYEAGLPVVLCDAEEILARYDGTGYIGIVPHDCSTRYCERLFPDRFGNIIDFIHVNTEEMVQFGDAIEWLPEDEARQNG